jgi:hypothetical protein
MKGIKDIAELLVLREGWNSHSAKPINRFSATKAIQILAFLLEAKTPAALVVPRVRGGIHWNGTRTRLISRFTLTRQTGSVSSPNMFRLVRQLKGKSRDKVTRPAF